jgi:hypothetical protein
MGFQPPVLPSAPGWHVVSTPVDTPDPEAGPRVIASNVPIADSDLSYALADGRTAGPAWPAQTIASLPDSGIVVVVSLPAPEWRPSIQGFGDFKPMTVPLKLSIAEIRQRWEGQPALNILQLILLAAVNDRYVEVKAFFGSQNPSARSLLAVQALLDRVEVPAP